MKKRKTMMAKALPYFLLLCFSIFVTMLTRYEVGHENYRMVIWFIIGWCIFLGLAALFNWRNPSLIKLNPLIVFLCLTPMLGSEPLFENDQYRYLWEGKVLSEGLNPWRVPPASEKLDFIDFPERELVGFNKLTSPYSPLAVIYHSLFSRLEYTYAIFMLQFFNAILCSLVFFFLPPLKPFYILGIAALLGKEFAQSVHIDLLVWCGMALALFFMRRGDFKFSAGAFIVSALLKVNILIAFPWFFFAAVRQRKLAGGLVWLLVALTTVGLNLLGPLSFNKESGLLAFMQHWVWHSGLLTLWQMLGGEINSGIQFANIIWGLGILGLGFFCIKRSVDGWRWATVLFSFSAFLRPAFNSWYFPWFGLSAAMAGQELAILYGLVSPLAYVKYANLSEGWLFSVILLTHFPGFLYLMKSVRFYRQKKIVNM